MLPCPFQARHRVFAEYAPPLDTRVDDESLLSPRARLEWRSGMTRTRVRTEHLIAGLLIVLMGAELAFESHSDRPATVDEPSWITTGYLTWRLVTEAAPPERWSTAYTERRLGAWGTLNPPLGKLIIGAAVAYAREPGDPVRYVWLWPYSYEANLKAGTLPPPSLLSSVRGVMVPFGVLALLLVYLIAREVSGTARYAPILAPLLLFSSRTFRDYSTMVFTDGPLLAFTLAALWFVLLWLRRTRPWQLAVALVCLGLACATKLNAGALVPVTALFVAMVPAPLKTRMTRALLAVAVPSAVFVSVNPYLWPRPLERTLSLIEGWHQCMLVQQADPANTARRVLDRLRAFDLILHRVLILPVRSAGPDGFASLWSHALLGMLVFAAIVCLTLAAFRWSGGGTDRRRVRIALVLGALAAPMTWVFPGTNALVALLLGLGAWRLALRLRGPDRFGASGYVTLFLLTTLVATWLWLPFDWHRYYLPLLGVTPVLGALGAIEIEQAEASLHVPPVAETKL